MTTSVDETVRTRPGAGTGLRVKRPADNRVFIATAVGAVLCDIAVRAGVIGAAGALAVIAAAAALIATGRAATTESKAIAIAAVPFGIFLAIRTSDWLIGPDLLAAAGLLTLAAVLQDGRSVFDLGITQLLVRGAAAGFHFIAAPGFLLTPVVRPRRPSAAVIRGAALAAPLLLVLVVLLASADAVFASLFDVPADATELVHHAVLMVIGAWGMAGLLRTASADTPLSGDVNAIAPAPKLGRVEANVVLGGLVALFAAFAVTQMVTAVGGANHVLRSRGLTYADYARSGFFQLLAVAALTMFALLAIRATTRLDKTTLLLAEAAVGLTIVIVGVALYRLSLYEEAYGLTMLRLYSQVFALWIAVVFVLLGASLLSQNRRQWLPAAAAATGLALLLVLNILNPEALVVKRNVSREKIDTVYLFWLSDDAVPALAKAGLTDPIDCRKPQPKGWAAANLGRARANAVRNRPDVCQP